VGPTGHSAGLRGGVLSKYNQELLVQTSSILENSNRNPSNSIEFQILELSLISNSNYVPNLKRL
jgi:hypothetical protein